MKKFEIHLHTNFSKCSNNKPEDVLKKAKILGLNGIAITDHNTIDGALKVKELNKDKNFEVIIGEEINSNIGHILVYYLKKSISPGNIKDILKEAKKQGAVVVLAHPYNILSSIMTKIFKIKNLRGTIDPENEVIKEFNGIEVFNSRYLFKKEIELSRKLAERYKKTAVAGSDAHFLSEVGNSLVLFEDKYTLKEAILKNKIKYYGKKRFPVFNRFKSFLRTR
ncbi:MAG: CehA/McbA family metallohydrolase [Candidatus Nanoarchaeia archaeon]|nr:CehA/McbA family metallohydrolase [Candidatus Nanoarchaeia archaeon]